MRVKSRQFDGLSVRIPAAYARDVHDLSSNRVHRKRGTFFVWNPEVADIYHVNILRVMPKLQSTPGLSHAKSVKEVAMAMAGCATDHKEHDQYYLSGEWQPKFSTGSSPDCDTPGCTDDFWGPRSRSPPPPPWSFLSTCLANYMRKIPMVHFFAPLL